MDTGYEFKLKVGKGREADIICQLVTSFKNLVASANVGKSARESGSGHDTKICTHSTVQ